jgi:23S rRNA (cytosine1962-C5)-methyltransferase
VFGSALERTETEPADGAEVVLKSHDGKFIGRGLFNSQSQLRVRLYGWGETDILDRDFWSRRIDEALDLRRQLFPEWGPEFACRLINSEGDQPG